MNSIESKVAFDEKQLNQREWIDDPTLTRAVKTADDDSIAKYKTAADIADVTAPPMHHPDSMYLRNGADLRNGLFMGGRMFVMQVSHPIVGKGVGDLSNFRSDPWHRLQEIAKSGEAYIFKGKEAALEEGKRLRDLHRNIKGIDKNGNPYHSLNPKVYSWVHVIFLDSMITMHKLYGTPLSRREQQALFLQWQEGGRVFGLRDQDMPRDIDDYYDYFNTMIAEELEYNEVMDYMLSLDKVHPPKPSDKIPDFIWNPLWKKLGKFYRELTLFSLPETYREKISPYQPWSREDQLRMEKWAERVKFFHRYTPERYCYDPKGYKIMKSLG